MALYQPASTIPSSFTFGTVDVNDNMEISWQVSGKSAMTAFQIDFYLNDYLSTPVISTGKITDGCPFYGTDRFGYAEFFTWNAKKSWTQWSFTNPNPFINGNQYKYRIIQWFDAPTNVVTITPTQSLSVADVYYFTLPNNTGYVKFIPEKYYAANSTKFYFDVNKRTGWTIIDNTLKEKALIYAKSLPEGATVVGEMTKDETASTEDFVIQTSFSVFITREKPTVTVFRCSDSTYSDKISLPNGSNINTSIGYFHAEYKQMQGDAVRWVRWQIAAVNDDVIGEILADTGDIYTPTLNYEFNGFFNGQSYAIRCLVKSEGEQMATVTNAPANSEDWVIFNTVIRQQEGAYTGSFTAKCLPKENAVELSWEQPLYIAPTVKSGVYGFTGGGGAGDSATYLKLGKDSVITWNEVGFGDSATGMSFSSPWTVAYKGTLDKVGSAFSREITKDGNKILGYLSAFSPDGTKLVVYGIESGNGSYTFIFNVTKTSSGLQYSFVDYLKINGSIIPQAWNINTLAFSPDGSSLILGGVDNANNRGVACVFNGQDFSYVGEITRNGKQFASNVYKVAFSPDGKVLVVGGQFANSATEGSCAIFSVNGTSFTYAGEVKDNTGAVLYSPIRQMTFIGDGANFALIDGQETSNDKVFVYTVSGTNINYLTTLSRGSRGFNGITALASPTNQNILVCAGSFSGKISIFNISQFAASYVGDINLRWNKDVVIPSVSNIAFSADGKAMAGIGYSGAVWCAVGENELVYMDTLYSNDASGDKSVAFYPLESTSYEVVVAWGVATYTYVINKMPKDKIFEIGNNLTLNRDTFSYVIKNTNGETLAQSIMAYKKSSFQIYHTFAVVVAPNLVQFSYYLNDSLGEVELLQSTESVINYEQQDINSISVYGGEIGSTLQNVTVFKGAGQRILPLYDSTSGRYFKPSWDSEDYQIEMSTNFNGESLSAGTSTIQLTGFRIYRQEYGKNYLTPITVPSNTNVRLKDYGILSRKVYRYLLYAYNKDGGFVSVTEADKLVTLSFQNYSLMVCDYDSKNDEYHVRKQYLFALNLSAGSVGNNNNPTLNANFTKYPTRMPSTQNYASGTLSGLIGTIYTVPALVEQIGNYKWTAKPSTMDYFDSVDLEKELYDLSTAPYQLFLRDMKGRLRMIATNSAISMTTNIKQKQQSISISFPWVEIGDASDVTIIQTPDDYGWSNDNQVLDTNLNVDIATGELTSVYPYPYSGTRFYLVGANNETLETKTPQGITPAQYDLSNSAVKPKDGDVKVSVSVNNEVTKND